MKRFLCLAIFTLTACSAAPSKSSELAQFMEGHFIAGQPDAETYFHDKRVRIAPLTSEGGEWLYYQINRGADDSVYRQRILHLVEGPNETVVQTAYTLTQPEQFSGMGDALKSISTSDLDTAFTAGCEMIWQTVENGWSGRVDPQTCIIDSSRRQTQIRIGSVSQLSTDGLRQGESGYHMDGSYLWGTKNNDDLYILTRQ